MVLPALQHLIFDVADWRRDENYEIYPVGSRPKELLIAPDPAPSPLIRPNHHYLFKSSSHNYPAQYWAEIIAYRIGLVAGVQVPPAFAAFDSRQGKPGALIEWFYDMRHEPQSETFIHGVDYLKRIIPQFDFKTGRQHNLTSNIRILNAIQKSRKLESPIQFWGRSLAFDSLIGNTDRHQENWGLLWPTAIDGPPPRFAPVFDNGTSLGHEQTEANLERFMNPDYLDRYIDRGRHHVRWRIDEERMSHFGLLARFVEEYPPVRAAVGSVARCDMSAIANEVATVSVLGADHGFSNVRSLFVLALLERRHHLLQKFC